MGPAKLVTPAVVLTLALAPQALAQDTTPPTVTDIRANGALLPDATLNQAPGAIVVTLSEAISAATVNTRSILLIRNAADRDTLVTPASVTLTSAAEVTIDLAGVEIPDGAYELVLLGSPPALGALSFDGSNDFVNVPVSPDLAGGSLTLEAWVFWNAVVHNTIIARWNDITRNYQYVLSVLRNGTIWFQVEPEVGYDIIARTIAPIPTQAWTHIAAAADASAGMKTIYINGVAQELLTDAAWDGTLRSVDMEVNIGRNPAQGRHWNGRIDEVRVWRVARTGSQIMQHMYRGLDGTETGLVGYYPMEDGSGQTVTDASAGGNDGTLGADASVAGDDPSWTDMDAPLTLGITDLAGNVLDGEYAGSFPSGDGRAGGNLLCAFVVAEPPPVVVSTVPADQGRDVPVGSTIAVTFSKPMDRASAEGAFGISGGVTGTFSWVDNCMIFTPVESLECGFTYAVVVSTEATDSDGRPMADPYVFAFTTAAEPQDGGDGDGGWCAAGDSRPAAGIVPVLGLLALWAACESRRHAGMQN